MNKLLAVFLLIAIFNVAVESRHMGAALIAKRQINIVGSACNLLGGLLNTVTRIVNSIMVLLSGLIQQVKDVLDATLGGILAVGANVAPGVAVCINGLVQEVTKLPTIIANDLQICVSNALAAVNIAPTSLCSLLTPLDAILNDCLLQLDLLCVLKGITDFGGTFIISLLRMLPSILILGDILLSCVDTVFENIAASLRAIITDRIDECIDA